MSRCKYPRERLHAWLDQERDNRSAQTREHLEHCRDCANLVDEWRRTGEGLRQIVDAAVGDVEPLVALEKIRRRVAEEKERSLLSRARRWWQELWLFNRRALAGIALAAALGALVAPGVVYLAGKVTRKMEGSGALGPAVVVESLELGDDSTAVVLGGEEGTTTLIWVEPGSHEDSSETF